MLKLIELKLLYKYLTNCLDSLNCSNFSQNIYKVAWITWAMMWFVVHKIEFNMFLCKHWNFYKLFFFFPPHSFWRLSWWFFISWCASTSLSRWIFRKTTETQTPTRLSSERTRYFGELETVSLCATGCSLSTSPPSSLTFSLSFLNSWTVSGLPLLHHG